MKVRTQRRGILGGLVGFGLMLGQPAISAEKFVTLAWDRNTEPDLAGYKVYIGTSPGTYSQTFDAGHVTTFRIPDLSPGSTYYIAVTAYDIFANESSHSVEIQVIIPQTPPAPSGPPPTAGVAGAGSSSQSRASLPQRTTSTADSGLPGPTVPPPVFGSPQAGPQVGHPAPPAQSTSPASKMGGEGGAGTRTDEGSSERGGSGGTPREEGVLQRLLAAIGLRSAGHRETRATSLYEEAQTLVTEGKYEEAILRYREAEQLWQGVGATRDLALVAEGLGTAYYGAGRYLEALDAFGMALRVSRQLKDREQEARILDDLGMTYEVLGEPATAIERYTASLGIWQSLGKGDQAAAVLERLRAAQPAANR